MKTKRYFIVVMLFILTVIAACGNESDTQQDGESDGGTASTETLTYAATSQSSGFYPYNVAVADIINNEVEGAEVTVIETGGTVDNLGLMEAGEAHFGQGADMDLYMGLNGLGAFDGETSEQGRMLFAAHPSGYFFVVTQESGVTKLSELEGVDYSPGLQGSITEINSNTFLSDILGYEPNYVPGSLNDAVDAVKDRRLDGVTRVAAITSPDSAIQDMGTAVDMHVLSFEEEEIDQIIDEFPFLNETVVDGSVYEQDEDIVTIGGFFGTMVSKELTEDLVYNIVEAIFENQDYIAEAYKGVEGFDLVKMTLDSGTWLHPGTIKYLEEQGHEVSEDLIPPEME